MKTQDIQPDKITKPMQLMAVWFIALLLLETAFLMAATKISEPMWVCPTLAIAAICFVPLFLLGIFLMQTVFRKELQDDQYYSEWLRRHEEAFADFRPENAPALTTGKSCAIQPNSESDLEELRTKRYAENKGLFLVHSWRPSTIAGQVADIVIWLQQHGDGPLTHGVVERVEYQLGPKFFEGPHTKTNKAECFRLEVSAYGPMLCIARVFILGETNSLVLERYIDFQEAPNKAEQRIAKKAGSR